MKLGIDFGTSFSFIAEWRDEEMAPQSRVRENIPTIFYYDEINGEKVGKEAEQLMLRIPRNGVRNIKKYIIERQLNYVFKLGEFKKVEGDEFTPGQVKEFTLREIIAKFIKNLINSALESRSYYYPRASGYYKDEIENIAVAIPVELNIEESWTFLQKCVAEAAGIPVNKVYFIHEPVAAAMSYFVLNKNSWDRILVYDLGGGTIDAAIVARDLHSSGSSYGVSFGDEFDDEIRYEVLAMHGEKIGGNDFDDELAGHIIDNIGHPSERASLKVNIKEQSAYGERFRKEITELKEKLSRNDKVSFAYERMSYKVDITSRQFENLTRDLLENTIEVTRRALRDYKDIYRSNAKLDAIVLSGGSSQMPMIMRRLEKFREEIKGDFPNLQIFMERPDCAISFGAAIYAANLDQLTFVAPYTYGVYLSGGQNFDMIYKNEPMQKHPDGKYISARKDWDFDTSKARDLRLRVYERDDRYSASQKPPADPATVRRETPEPDTFGFRPAFEVYIPVYGVGGKLGLHSLCIELKLIQGKPVELHIYDNDQDGKELGLESPEVELERAQEPIEVSREDGRRELPDIEREKEPAKKKERRPGFDFDYEYEGNIILNWFRKIRRFWGRLFSKK